MGAFLSYCIISGLVMLALYLAYRLSLAKDNQHSFNRGVLLLIYLVSFAAPAVYFYTDAPRTTADAQTMMYDGIGLVSSGAISPAAKPMWGTALIWIYLAGMIIVGVKTVITWARLINVIRSGRKFAHEGYTLVVTDNERFAPFSWMRYVVISRSDYDNNYPAIAAHELKHVACRHWIDLLVAQAVCIANWFNPAAWLMRDELMLIHEYQADMAVIDSGYDTQQYQLLLIKKAVGARFPSLANSLNHSKLKKRITMMYKEKSGAGRRLRALALVPMLALALCVAGVPAVRAAVMTIGSSDVSIDKGSEKPSQDKKITVQYFKVTKLNNDGNNTTVVVKGKSPSNTMTVSGGTFTNKGKTYRANAINFDMMNDDVTITAQFPCSDEYKKPRMALTINGEEVPFDLEEFFSSTHNVAVENNSGKAKTIVLINGQTSTVPDDMTVYVDGKEVSTDELGNIAKCDISAVTVNQQKKTIEITTKN